MLSLTPFCSLICVHSSKKPKSSIYKAVPKHGQAPGLWKLKMRLEGWGHRQERKGTSWCFGRVVPRAPGVVGRMPALPPQLLRAPPPPCPAPSHLQTTLNSQTCLQSQTAGESCHVTGPGLDPPHPGRTGCPDLCLPFPGGTGAFSLQSSRGSVAQTCFEYQGFQRSKKASKVFWKHRVCQLIKGLIISELSHTQKEGEAGSQSPDTSTTERESSLVLPTALGRKPKQINESIPLYDKENRQ